MLMSLHEHRCLLCLVQEDNHPRAPSELHMSLRAGMQTDAATQPTDTCTQHAPLKTKTKSLQRSLCLMSSHGRLFKGFCLLHG